MSDVSKQNETAAKCVAAFQFLCDEFGFSHPEFLQVGRESNLYFTRGNRTVGGNWEAGSLPLVEFFEPTVDIEHRRIPRVRPAVGRGRHALRPEVPEDVDRFLAQYAAALRTQEEAFLVGRDNA